MWSGGNSSSPTTTDLPDTTGWSSGNNETSDNWGAIPEYQPEYKPDESSNHSSVLSARVTEWQPDAAEFTPTSVVTQQQQQQTTFGDQQGSQNQHHSRSSTGSSNNNYNPNQNNQSCNQPVVDFHGRADSDPNVDSLAIYVNNLPKQCYEEDIHQCFSPFGSIVDIKMYTEKGFLFLWFVDPESVDEVLKYNGTITLKGHTLMIRRKKIQPGNPTHQHGQRPPQQTNNIEYNKNLTLQQHQNNANHYKDRAYKIKNNANHSYYQQTPQNNAIHHEADGYQHGYDNGGHHSSSHIVQHGGGSRRGYNEPNDYGSHRGGRSNRGRGDRGGRGGRDGRGSRGGRGRRGRGAARTHFQEDDYYQHNTSEYDYTDATNVSRHSYDDDVRYSQQNFAFNYDNHSNGGRTRRDHQDKNDGKFHRQPGGRISYEDDARYNDTPGIYGGQHTNNPQHHLYNRRGTHKSHNSSSIRGGHRIDVKLLHENLKMTKAFDSAGVAILLDNCTYNSPGCFSNDRIIPKVLSQLARAKRLHTCLHIVSWCEENSGRINALTNRPILIINTFYYSALLLACDMCRKWREALRTLNRMKPFGVKLDNVMCSLALRACEHEEEGWYAGLQLFDKVSYEEDAKRDCPPDKVIYSTAIKICGKARLWKRAEEILKLRHILDPPDERDYSQLINSTEKHKDGRRAVIWMKEMKRLKVTPSVFSFNAAISACGKSFMPGQAVTYLEQLKQTKYVDPTIVSYGSIITACERSNLWRNALAFFDEMQEECCRPNAPTYNAIILACAKGKQWDHVIRLLKKLMVSDVRPTGATLLAVLTGCSLIRGHGGDALDFLREAGRSWNVEPGPNHYRLALLSCVRDQSIELVHGIYAMMERYNVSNRFSIEISTVLLQCMYANQQENNRNDLLKQAEEVIVSMKAQHIEPDRSLYNISIQAFSNLGAYQQAMQYFEEMAMSSQQKGDPLYPNHSTYMHAIEASGNHFKLEKVVSLFEEAKLKFVPDETLYCTTIRACGQCLAWQLALSIFEEMEQCYRPRRTTTSTTHTPKEVFERGTMLSNVAEKPNEMESVAEESTLETASTTDLDKDSDSLASPSSSSSPSIPSSSSSLPTRFEWDNCNTTTDHHNIDESIYPPKPIRIACAGIKSYTEVLAACYKSKRYQMIEKLWKTILKDTVEPDAETYGIMMLTIAHGKQEAEIEINTEVDTKQVNPDDLQLLMNIVKADRLEKLWLEDMKLSTSIVVEPTASCYASLMSAYIAIGDRKQAMSIGKECQDKGHLDACMVYGSNELILNACPLTAGTDGQLSSEMAVAVVLLFIEDNEKRQQLVRKRKGLRDSDDLNIVYKIWTDQPRIAKMTEDRVIHLRPPVIELLNSIQCVHDLTLGPNVLMFNINSNKIKQIKQLKPAPVSTKTATNAEIVLKVANNASTDPKAKQLSKEVARLKTLKKCATINDSQSDTMHIEKLQKEQLRALKERLNVLEQRSTEQDQRDLDEGI